MSGAMFFAILERGFPRLASAATALALSALVAPAELGGLTWGLAVLAVIQSGTDAAIRQVAVPGIMRGETSFLRRYSLISALAGPIIVGALLVIPARAGLVRLDFGMLWPLMLVPIATATTVLPVGRAQLAGKWREIATAQLVGSGAALVLGVAILAVSRSVIAGAAQAASAEAMFALLIRRVRVARTERPCDELRATASVAREFGASSAYGILGWAQMQLERLLIGGIGGPGILGLYGFSWNASRSLSDAISVASVNVLRPRLELSSEADRGRLLNRSLHRLTLAQLAVASVVTMAVALYAKYILGPEWAPIERAIPFMALSAVPVLFTWTSTPILVRDGRLKSALPVRSLGVILALPVAWLATRSLELGALALLLRETVVATLLLRVIGPTAPWSAYRRALMYLVVLGGGVILVLGLA